MDITYRTDTITDCSGLFGERFDGQCIESVLSSVPANSWYRYNKGGFGTVAGVMELQYKETSGPNIMQWDHYFLLTAAHVAHPWMTDCYRDFESQCEDFYKGVLSFVDDKNRDLLLHHNNRSTYSAYVRKALLHPPTKPLQVMDHAFILADAAIVKAAEDEYAARLSTRQYFRLPANETYVPPDWINGGQICDCWKSIIRNAMCFMDYRVLKFGAKTSFSKGTFKGFALDGSILTTSEPIDAAGFTAAGDSGSLIVLDVEECGLLPIGVHFASDSAGSSYSIPLWKVLAHFYDANALQGTLKVRFVSPSLKIFTFKREMF